MKRGRNIKKNYKFFFILTSLFQQHNIVTHVIKVIIRALEITYTHRAPKGQPNIISDINGFGSSPRGSIIHLSMSFIDLPCKIELKRYRGQHK